MLRDALAAPTPDIHTNFAYDRAARTSGWKTSRQQISVGGQKKVYKKISPVTNVYRMYAVRDFAFSYNVTWLYRT